VDTQSASISAVVRSAIGEVFVPPGDPAEQLLANLILAVTVTQLHTDGAALPFLNRAHEIALTLSRVWMVYRPKQPSKFARLTFEADGTLQNILYPVIDGNLIVPAIAPEAIVRAQPVLGETVRLIDLSPARYMLRIRTRPVVEELNAIRTKVSHDKLAAVVDRILTKSLQQELPSVHALDRANESFSLARDLIGKRNYPLASLALTDAATAVDQYGKCATIESHAEIVSSMKEQVARMLQQIKRRGM
jgi:hypothetical protein